MTKKKVTSDDIAKQLGVSKALVSFVLNGKGKEKRISDEMCRRVFEVAGKLNYQPNQIARWFRTGKTQTIGLIIADISNPFFGKLGREIEREAALQGYKVIFCSSDESPVKFGKQLDMLINSRVDGFVMAPPPGSEEQVKAIEMSKLPYVLIDRFFPSIDSNYVVIDNYAAAYKATVFLLKKGYTKIAFLTVNDELVTMHDRTRGYLQALQDSGLTLGEKSVYRLPFSHSKDDVKEAIVQLAGEKEVGAILFSSSKIGLMGMEVMVELGIRIPEDIAIVSFDDPDFYKVCISPVTAIAQPLSEMGSTAVKILTSEIEAGEQDLLSRKIVLESKFIERKSSGE